MRAWSTVLFCIASLLVTSILGPAMAIDQGTITQSTKSDIDGDYLAPGVLRVAPSNPAPDVRSTDHLLSQVAYSATSDAGSAEGRMTAVLDLTARNGETGNSTFALNEALNIAGVPHIVTTNVASASAYRIIYTSSSISSTTLRTSERNALKNYVNGGGVLVSTNVSDSGLNSVFGISGSLRANTRHSMTWQTGTNDESLRYFDDPLEITISFGRQTTAAVIYTRGYILNGAQEIGELEDGSAGVTKKNYGKGTSYALGFSYTDVVLRNMLNSDFNAQRVFSNGFEPSTDTIVLFLRGVYEAHVPFAVWKHTSVSDSSATVMITHDVDSETAMDMIDDFASLEAAYSVVGTFNVTTHYISDRWDKDFYTANIDELQYYASQGIVMDSHSVGHFRDFNNETTFPIGFPGNDRASYLPYYNGLYTTDGTVFGELEVSKDLLENEIGADVRSFRAGHLAFNDNLIGVLDQLGYEFDSSMSANDVLLNFPYLSKAKRSFSGAVTDVYEIPMTISDSKLDAINYPSKVDNWVNITEQNANNFAPTVLLIHPNRDYKMTAEEHYINRLGSDIAILDLDTFGTFWQDRAEIDVLTELSGSDMMVTILGGQAFPPSPEVSLYVRDGAQLSSISVQQEDGTPVSYQASPAGTSDLIIFEFN